MVPAMVGCLPLAEKGRSIRSATLSRTTSPPSSSSIVAADSFACDAKLPSVLGVLQLP